MLQPTGHIDLNLRPALVPLVIPSTQDLIQAPDRCTIYSSSISTKQQPATAAAAKVSKHDGPQGPPLPDLLALLTSGRPFFQT